MDHTKMIAKVKAIGVNFGWYMGAAVITAILEFSDTVDWNGFGIFGPAIGLAVAGGLDWLTSYFKRSAPADFQVTKPGDAPHVVAGGGKEPPY